MRFAFYFIGMHETYKVALYVHIISGFLALITGAVALIVRKGKGIHILSGKMYVLLMLVVAVSALVLSLLKSNIFLLLIAFFAIYQTITGYRAVTNKSQRPNLFDWLIMLLGVFTGTYMILTWNLVLIVFGAIAVFLAILDLRTYLFVLSGRTLPPLVWLRRHIGFMVGAYIATFTAFVVVNIRYEAVPWLPWLAPTIVGIPLMQYWTWKFTKSAGKKTMGGELSHTDHTENES